LKKQKTLLLLIILTISLSSIVPFAFSKSNDNKGKHLAWGKTGKPEKPEKPVPPGNPHLALIMSMDHPSGFNSKGPKVKMFKQSSSGEPETLEEIAANDPYIPSMAPSKIPNKGKSKHLYLFEKDPETWNIVEKGAFGKLRYFEDGKFVFNGHGLEENDYSLIYYPDPWPGSDLKIIGSAITNKGRNVHIMGIFDFTRENIPILNDDNYDEGAKIWLVLSDDINKDVPENKYMDGWNPNEYLFEYKLINQPENEAEP
jgi:hypothetical protein